MLKVAKIKKGTKRWKKNPDDPSRLPKFRAVSRGTKEGMTRRVGRTGRRTMDRADRSNEIKFEL